MPVGRVTQQLMTQRSLQHMQVGSDRLARLQEQLTTGRTINRPSDSPAGTATAMRLRSSVAQAEQRERAAQDGAAWLDTADGALTAATGLVRQARELGQQAVNGATSPAAREALAVSVQQLRADLVSVANTTYLDRPVFGGVTAGARAYDDTGTYVGREGAVVRAVGDDTKVRVDVPGRSVFGPDGDGVFTHLDDLAAALRSGDGTATSAALGRLAGDLTRIGTAQAEAGSRAAAVERAGQAATDLRLRAQSSLGDVENTDLPATVIQLRLQEVAYQAALGATARVLQPSLMDFLR